MESVVLTADLGGTNLRMAVVDRDGRVLFRHRRETPRSADRDLIVSAIIEAAELCREAAPENTYIKAIAAAAAATINPAAGVLSKAPNMPALDGLHLTEILSSKLRLPVFLENDATAAAIGEHWLGASKGFASSICVTLGTGVGGGIILNDKPLRGPDGTAGEIGHICVEPDGEPCGCGSRGCVEQYSSATAIVRIASELRAEHPDSVLGFDGDVTSLDIFNAGKRGDPLALKAFTKMGRYLGIALADLINVLNPEVIVIGGGMAAGWEMFIGHVRAEIAKRAFREPAVRAKLVAAELGDDAGILGAARLAFLAKT